MLIRNSLAMNPKEFGSAEQMYIASDEELNQKMDVSSSQFRDFDEKAEQTKEESSEM